MRVFNFTYMVCDAIFYIILHEMKLYFILYVYVFHLFFMHGFLNIRRRGNRKQAVA